MLLTVSVSSRRVKLLHQLPSEEGKGDFKVIKEKTSTAVIKDWLGPRTSINAQIYDTGEVKIKKNKTVIGRTETARESIILGFLIFFKKKPKLDRLSWWDETVTVAKIERLRFVYVFGLWGCEVLGQRRLVKMVTWKVGKKGQMREKKKCGKRKRTCLCG